MTHQKLSENLRKFETTLMAFAAQIWHLMAQI